MNEDIKARWVAALRSGEYEQGRGALNVNGKFCCLGVLCELAVQDGVIEPPTPRKWDGDNAMFYDNERGYAPYAVGKWAGFELRDVETDVDDDGETIVIEHYEQDPLGISALNDAGKTFTELADLIEEKL